MLPDIPTVDQFANIFTTALGKIIIQSSTSQVGHPWSEFSNLRGNFRKLIYFRKFVISGNL